MITVWVSGFTQNCSNAYLNTLCYPICIYRIHWWKHICFIDCKTHEDATTLIKRLTHLKWNGYKIRAKIAKNQHDYEVVDQIVIALHETNPTAIARIKRIVYQHGFDYIAPFVAQALQIDSTGGMFTKDKSRKRTPGGILLYLLSRNGSD